MDSGTPPWDSAGGSGQLETEQTTVCLLQGGASVQNSPAMPLVTESFTDTTHKVIKRQQPGASPAILPVTYTCAAYNPSRTPRVFPLHSQFG